MKVESFGLTHPGKKRSHNEDAFVENSAILLYGVADGMGGHEAGEVASRVALDLISSELRENIVTLRRYGQQPDNRQKTNVFGLLDAAVQKACRRIYEISSGAEGGRGMGTTVSVLLLVGRSAFIAHVGDSRVYLYRNGSAFQLTDDHTLVNDHIKKGIIDPEGDGEELPFNDVLTRAVGLMERVMVDTFFLDLADGDRFLLCSDGLHHYLPEASALNSFMAIYSLESVARRLVDHANQGGGRDNITTVVVEVSEVAIDQEIAPLTTRVDIMQQLSLFEFLDYKDIMTFLTITTPETLPRGAELIAEGGAADRFYCIVNGQVEITHQGVYITTLGKGDHIGEMALIDDQNRSATVTAVTDLTVLTVRRADFDRLMKQQPRVAGRIMMNIARTLSHRLRDTTENFAAWRNKQLARRSPDPPPTGQR